MSKASAFLLLLAACTHSPGDASTRTKPAIVTPPATPASADPPAAPLDAQLIAERLGAPVRVEATIVRGLIPRGDLHVSVGGSPAPRALDLGTSLEFTPGPRGARLSGSAALLEDEVSPVLDTLLAHGIEVIGLHNRFSFDEPRLLLMHFEGEGNAALLASGVQSISASIRDARSRAATPRQNWAGDPPAPGGLDAQAIGGALGGTAEARDGEVSLSVPRENTSPAGAGAALATVLTAAWTGSDLRSAVAGSFSLTRSELAPVLAGLRRGNLTISALQPSAAAEPARDAFLVYFYGRGSSLELVRALRLALEARSSAPH
jgi:hypothetical protein